MTRRPAGPGPVLLVGAGPGDPDLLTLRAEAALAAAAVVVTDAAVRHLAAAFAPDAVVVTAGADPAAVAERCRATAPAVRLYRGDPWLHPRFAAEAAALAALGVAHEAVPGPPAELALAGAAGLAVHHRPRSVTVTLGPVDALPPAVDPARTLVAEAADVRAAARELAAAAGDPGLPAAAVTAGGAVERRALRHLAAVVPAGPGLVVIGAVTAP